MFKIEFIKESNLLNLTNEELLKLYKDGHKEVKDVIFEKNKKMIMSICKKYSHKIEMEDLFQIGSIGLLKSIENFEVDRGFLFSTYAFHNILGEIKKYNRDQTSSVKINRQLQDIYCKVLNEKDKNKNKEMSYFELAERLDIPVDLIRMSMESHQDTLSIFQPLSNTEGDDLYMIDNLCSEENGYDKIINKMSLDTLISNLKAQDKEIIMLRYFNDKTQSEVAATLGISQAHVSRLEKNVLSQMKQALTC